MVVWWWGSVLPRVVCWGVGVCPRLPRICCTAGGVGGGGGLRVCWWRTSGRGLGGGLLQVVLRRSSFSGRGTSACGRRGMGCLLRGALGVGGGAVCGVLRILVRRMMWGASLSPLLFCVCVARVRATRWLGVVVVACAVHARLVSSSRREWVPAWCWSTTVPRCGGGPGCVGGWCWWGGGRWPPGVVVSPGGLFGGPTA